MYKLKTRKPIKKQSMLYTTKKKQEKSRNRALYSLQTKNKKLIKNTKDPYKYIKHPPHENPIDIQSKKNHHKHIHIEKQSII